MALEIEAKLAAWPGFELPPLDGCLDGVTSEARSPRTMDARYLDADDLRLVRAGITLRHRTGEGGVEGAWTLKTSVGGPSDLARRDEWIVEGGVDEVPDGLLTAVRPHLRGATLRVVAHLRTERRRTCLASDGEVLAEIDDDEVSVLVDGHVAARFREVEVECADESLLRSIVEELRRAGAGAPDPTSKLVRALGPRALQPPDLSPVAVDEDSSGVDVLRAGITAAVLRIIANDSVIREGGDPEGVHQARVGCRRLRSDLRTFRPLLERSWADPLRDELRWLAGELGAVRDLDVLGARLEKQIAALPDRHRNPGRAVLRRLEHERERAVEGAVAALDSDRYLSLLDRLVEAASQPRVSREARKAAVDVVPPLAASAYARLRKHVRRLPPDPSDDALHDLRIEAKRARYAIDVAVPVVGKPAARSAKAVGRLQDVLGDLHDLAVAEEWLEEVAGSMDAPTAYVHGLLVAQQAAEREELRAGWRTAWDDLDRRSLTAWMA